MFNKFKMGLATIYIYKESGNLWVSKKPIMFSAVGYDNEPLALRDYMNLKEITLEEAVRILNECGVILLRHTFDICFYDEESVNKFIEVSKEIEIA